MKHQNVFLKNCVKAIFLAPAFIAVVFMLSLMSAKIAISTIEHQTTQQAVTNVHTARTA